jgi:hypothetical protein
MGRKWCGFGRIENLPPTPSFEERRGKYIIDSYLNKKIK